VGLDLIDAIAAQNLEPNSDEADPVSARGSALRLLLALIVDLQNQIAEAASRQCADEGRTGET
jgi:hypothetical protein